MCVLLCVSVMKFVLLLAVMMTMIVDEAPVSAAYICSQWNNVTNSVAVTSTDTLHRGP